MSREALAYAGGLFEGEGSISCSRRNDRHAGFNVQLTIGMTDLEPLERARYAIGLGNLYGPYGPYGISTKPVYRWIVCGHEQVQAAVAMLWPWLSQRRRTQATAALAKFLGKDVP